MSGDGGYFGSFEHANANLHIGRELGISLGFDEGFKQGYSEGWEAGIAAGNVEIKKQMEFTRQHIAEKNRIMAQLAEQKAKIVTLEEENFRLRSSIRK
jgi:flagellar biosynthesis/type III secretory pathway protein FliH